MKAIIFGANGQDGFYLSQLLTKQKIEIIGVSRKGDKILGDVSDLSFTGSLLKKHQPEFIFHLAANSTTRHEALFENHETISTGTFNILENVRMYCPRSHVFLSGSAMQFKNDGSPISENTPFEARSPYAVARIQSVYAGRYFRNTFGLKIYTGYFFNHDSPLRTEKHVNQKIAKTVLRIAAGSEEKLELGDVTVQKEFNYAGDMMEAVWMLINQDMIFEAVIGNGQPYSIQDWLEYCFKQINKNWQDFVILKQGFVPEYKILVSNPKLIMSLGWQPQVDFYQLADMMMDEK